MFIYSIDLESDDKHLNDSSNGVEIDKSVLIVKKRMFYWLVDGKQIHDVRSVASARPSRASRLSTLMPSNEGGNKCVAAYNKPYFLFISDYLS